ncbi:MAG: hypothetical protein R8L53_01050 [Mariprofundales bacterium]
MRVVIKSLQIRRLGYRLQRLGDLELEYWLKPIAAELAMASMVQLQQIEHLLDDDTATLQIKMRTNPSINLYTLQLL